MNWKLFSFVNRLIVIIILIISFSLFVHYLRININSNFYDENSYINLSSQITNKGLYNFNEPLRTYFLSLLISLCRLFTDGNIKTIKILFSVLQFTIYLFTILLMANKFYQITNKKIYWNLIFIIGMLNVYLLNVSTLFLTDLLSTCLLTISIVLILTTDLHKTKNFIIAITPILLSIVTRPSALIFLLLVSIIILIKIRHNLFVLLRNVLITIMLSLVIFSPQIYNNFKEFNEFNPLIHEQLYEKQSIWSAHYLKYGTVVIPNETPQLYYNSPFKTAENTNIYELMFENPLNGLVLVVSHIFGVIDWGYIESYINDFYPKGRIVGSIYLYTFWYLVILGVYDLLKRNFYSSESKKFIYGSLLFLVSFYLIFISTTVVESRFGFPIFMLLLPLSTIGMEFLIKKFGVRKNYFKPTLIVASYVLFLIIMFNLSFIMDMQTNRIFWYRHLF